MTDYVCVGGIIDGNRVTPEEGKDVFTVIRRPKLQLEEPDAKLPKLEPHSYILEKLMDSYIWRYVNISQAEVIKLLLEGYHRNPPDLTEVIPTEHNVRYIRWRG